MSTSAVICILNVIRTAYCFLTSSNSSYSCTGWESSTESSDCISLPMPLPPSLLRLATIAAWGTSGPPLRPRAKRDGVLRGLGVRHWVDAVARRLPVAHYWQKTTTLTVTVFTTKYHLHDHAAPLKPPQRIIATKNSNRNIGQVLASGFRKSELPSGLTSAVK